MNQSKVTLTVVFSIAVLSIAFFVLSLLNNVGRADASVRRGDQYQATTTPQLVTRTNLCPARFNMASSTTGILGSVVITKSGTGAITIYDATTTNINFRVNQATSSIIIADFPSSPDMGTYTFDIEFKRGLLIDTSGSVSTSTITYRCEG